MQQPGVICMSFNQNKQGGWPFLIALRSGAAHVESEAADLLAYSMCPVALRWLQRFNERYEADVDNIL